MTPADARKHAVAGINAAVAEELAPHGITANCYAPTICETDMLTRIDKDLSAIAGAEAGAFIAMVSNPIPSFPLPRPSHQLRPPWMIS